jgi:hypothetical protein
MIGFVFADTRRRWLLQIVDSGGYSVDSSGYSTGSG